MAVKRGPDGKFLSKAELAAEAAQREQDSTETQTKTNNKREKQMSTEIEFVDELPTIERKREGGTGVWAERLEPLRDNVMKWGKVFGPTKNPHAVIANVTNGNVAGVPDVDYFEFAGRTFETGEVEEDEDGNETPVREGWVFARYMDENRYEERQAELAEKRAKREAREAAKASA